MYTIVLALTALLAIGANAQSSTGTASGSPSIPSLDACTSNCLNQAIIAGGCGTLTNLTCLCGSSTFQANATACLQSCGAADLASAIALQGQECGTNSTNGTTSNSSSSASGSSTSSAGSASQSSNSSSGSGTNSGALSLTLGSGSSAGALLVAAAAMVGGVMMVL